jgi:chitin disaccharide deacetylase
MSGRRVILNADDFGYDPAVSKGIALAMREGVVSSTTMMVNTPHSEDAAALAEGLAVGLHLNLARWSAVSSPTLSFVEAEANTLEASFVEAEALAQLQRLKSLLGRPATHLDVHKHLHRLPQVLEGVIRAAVATGTPVRSIDAPMREALRARGVVTNDVFLGDAGTDAYWTMARFEAVTAKLPEAGVIELMCHPGFAPRQVVSGYAAQREVELATFLAPEARALLEARGLRLSGWRS